MIHPIARCQLFDYAFIAVYCTIHTLFIDNLRNSKALMHFRDIHSLVSQYLSVVVLGLDEVGKVDWLRLGPVCLMDVLGSNVLHLVAAATFRAAAKRAVTGDLVVQHNQQMSQKST